MQPGQRPGPGADPRAQAMELHRRGDLGNAERLYRQVLKTRPDDAQVLNALGCLCQQAGRPGEAEKLIRKSIQLAPDQVDFRANFARLLHALGRSPEAATAYREALARDPQRRDLWVESGMVAEGLYDGAGALAALEKARGLGPPDAGLLNLIAQVKRRGGDPAGAAEAWREALALRPGEPELLLGLGLAEKDCGRYEASLDALRQAVKRAPGNAELQRELGQVLVLAGREEEAAELARALAGGRPGDEAAVSVAGSLLSLAGKGEAAEALYRDFLARRPDALGVKATLAGLAREAGRLDEALALAGEALARRAELPEAETVLVQAALESADIASARRHMERAAKLLPQSASAASTLVALESYDPAAGEAEMARAARRWQDRFESPLALARKSFAHRDRDPARRLRIGYVSPDFRRHSVAFFIEPLLAAHDRSEVEVFCYAELGRPDAVSRRLEGLADVWRQTAGQGDRQVAGQVRRDEIDILVDLAGHTTGNRLLTFAQKPAPLQVTWLGYPGTTGLESIDARLTDAVADPPGEADRHHSEGLIRLEGGFLCYRPPEEAPPVAPSPCGDSGAVTFGSFNLPAKIGPGVLDAWAEILKALPEARLLMKGKGLGEPRRQVALRQAMAARGVAGEQLEIVGLIPDLAAHLALYERIDVALDSFPYNGTTTSFEALWMGVPLVTFAGARHAGRVGASILTHIGLDELVAKDVQGYMRQAVGLAGDRARLAALRAGLREWLRASPFLDEAGFARRIEAVYRDLWRAWCGR